MSSHAPVTATKRHRVVILGAGYAGVRAVRDLARQVAKVNLDIVLITAADEHLDVTLLYEVAAAYLKHESSVSSETISASVQLSLAQMLARSPVRLVIGFIESIDQTGRLVRLRDNTTFEFDTLVVALGTHLATFNIPGIGEHTFSIKTLPEALELRHHIVRQFIQARELTGLARQSALTFVVAGAGASGVELAAELVGHARHECQRHEIVASEVAIILIEAGPRILSTMPEAVSVIAQQRLNALGITVRLGQRIVGVTPTEVKLGSYGHVYCRTVVWTAGLAPHPVIAAAGFTLKHWGVAVTPTLQVPGQPNIFVAGDAAIIASAPNPIPATVPVAYSQGSLVAKNIVNQRLGRPLIEYRYSFLGAVVTLGQKYAVATFHNGRILVGYRAWLLKKIVILHYWLSVTTWREAGRLWVRAWHIHGAND